MRKFFLSFNVMVLVICIICLVANGCKRKEPESPFTSALPDLNNTVTISTEDEMVEPTVLEQEEVRAGAMPPVLEETVSSIETPTPEQLQAALKNAGYYKGEIDGKIGKMSTQAILDFQKDNGLEADGKVGPKTWSKLKNYLNTQNAPKGQD